MKSLGTLFALLGLTACQDPASARDQWLITISTDGALPQFGNRLLVEAIDEEGTIACDACRRTFGVSATDLPLSFGLSATSGASRVRARLYRAGQTGPDGFPGGAGLIDGLGRLPEARGVTPVALPLSLNCFGLASDGDQTCAPETGTLVPSPLLADDLPLDVGSWWGLASVPCATDAPDDMACIEGGAFIRGNYDDFGPSPLLSGEKERLVVLSPFVLERDEVTVGEVRALLQSGALDVEPILPDPDPRGPTGTCTYLGTDDPTNDALPVNCVPFGTAVSICQALGRRLPTEAEWEFAAGQRTLESPFPWGSDPEACDLAIVGVGRLEEAYFAETTPCRGQADGQLRPWGMQPGGDPDDVTAQGIRNLGGNVTEFSSDAFEPYGEGCHADLPRPAIDPVCVANTGRVVARGGSWNSTVRLARSTSRQYASGWSPSLGLRCAASATTQKR